MKAYSDRQFSAKVRQFSRGTRFFFPRSYQGNRYWRQRLSMLTRALGDAGMEVVDEPPPNLR